jgi:hypothetical protein
MKIKTLFVDMAILSLGKYGQTPGSDEITHLLEAKLQDYSEGV